MFRHPQFSQQYYPSSFTSLDVAIRHCFTHSKGPGDLPTKRRSSGLKALLVPHSPYQTSGPCASWCYKELAEQSSLQPFVLLGGNHSLPAPDFSTCLFSDWQTPFGIAKVNRSLGHAMLKRFSFLKNDLESHQREHCLEVQLPFLQFSQRDRLSALSFVPLLVNSRDVALCRRLGETLAQIYQETPFTLLGTFEFPAESISSAPAFYQRKSYRSSQQKEALSYLEALDGEGFASFVQKKALPVCCFGAVITFLSACSQIGATHGRVLSFSSSESTDGSSASYAGMVFS